MDLSKLSLVFKIIIISIIYIIIFTALRIIYKDVKNGGKKSKKASRASFGIEVVNAGNNSNLRKGAVFPIQREITVGRREDNMLALEEAYVSGHHAKIYMKNEQCILEDLGSTNGTSLNGEKITKKELLKSGDEIIIGSAIFKVI